MAITKLPRSGIADNSINASKIEDGTVAAAEISGTVSAAKLNATLDISGKTVTLPNTSVTSGMLANTTIANAKLANSAITVRGTSRALGTSFSLGVDVDWQSVVVSDGSTVTTMAAGKGYFVNNTSAAGIVKLPTSATLGDTIAIKDYVGNFGTNALTIQRNGHNIQAVANDSRLSTNRASIVLVYVDATKGWLYKDEHNVADLQRNLFTEATGGTVTESGDFKIHKFTGDGNFVVSQVGAGTGPAVVDYLVVAGGGGSGGGGAGYDRTSGGGGGGGFREAKTCAAGSHSASPLETPTGITLTAQTYPITVGGGGAGSTGGNAWGTKGSNSVFSTITSTGGGQGGSQGGGYGMPGGSGGGVGGFNHGPGGQGTTTSATSGNSPPVSPPQGNNGGGGRYNEAGAGGGGATGAGSSPSGPTGCGAAGTGGPSGAGATTTISGSPITYAGGGAGAGQSGNGSAGSGGTNAGSAGSSNTGRGGGGATGGTGAAGHSGGSGIVIIRYKFQ
jgi:hypothetical protein